MNVFPEEEPKEPFYLTYAFYDIQSKLKLTEDFYVEFNENPHLSKSRTKQRKEKLRVKLFFMKKIQSHKLSNQSETNTKQD